MDLYVCWGAFGPGSYHPCARAHNALKSAGQQHTLVRTYGCYGTDRFFPGRRKIKDLTGTYKVPTLILADGTIIDGSEKIVAWAAAHPS
jgi:hypothetical protein